MLIIRFKIRDVGKKFFLLCNETGDKVLKLACRHNKTVKIYDNSFTVWKERFVWSTFEDHRHQGAKRKWHAMFSFQFAFIDVLWVKFLMMLMNVVRLILLSLLIQTSIARLFDFHYSYLDFGPFSPLKSWNILYIHWILLHRSSSTSFQLPSCDRLLLVLIS